MSFGLAVLIGFSFGLKEGGAEERKTKNIENLMSNDIENIAKIKRTVKKTFERVQEIEYTSDGIGTWNDYWQTPKETEKRKKGDCEDMAFYLSDLLKKEGIKNRVVLGFIDTKETYEAHAWVEYSLNGLTYVLDPTSTEIVRRKDLKNSYEEISNIYSEKKNREYEQRLVSQTKKAH